MKKIEVSIKEKTFYKIVLKIGDFAVVEDNERIGLIVLQSGNFIVQLDDYVLDRDGDFLIFTTKNTEKDQTEVEIFNTKTRYHYSKRKLVEKIKDGALIIRNAFDDKMRFFCSKASYKNYDVYNNEFDSYTLGEMDGKYWILFNLGDKKGLFVEGRGMVLPLEQDDIQIIGNKIIFTKDGKTQLIMGPIWTKEYSSIRVDPNLEDIVYYRKGNKTFVYYIGYHNKDAKPIQVPIIKTHGDSVELAYYKRFSDSFYGVYQFIVGENGCYTVREVVINKVDIFKEGSLVTDESYEKINYENEFYTVYKNGVNKVLLPYRDNSGVFLKTISLGNDFLACFSKYGKCHIRNLSDISEKGVFEDAKSIRPVENGFIYGDGTKEILFVSNNGNTFSDSADEIQFLGGNYYTTLKNGVKRLRHYGKELSCQNILKATIHSDNDSNTFDNAKNVWAILEIDRPHKRFQLACMVHHNNKPATNFKVLSDYKWVAFYPDFILTLNDKIKLYSYTGESLAVLPPLTTIDVVGHCGKSGKDVTIYSIDGESYIVQYGEFINIPAQEKPLHMAVYEGVYGYVAVNASSQEEFAKKCSAIESMDEISFEATLKANYNSSMQLQEQYPSLTLKQVKPKK